LRTEINELEENCDTVGRFNFPLECEHKQLPSGLCAAARAHFSNVGKLRRPARLKEVEEAKYGNTYADGGVYRKLMYMLEIKAKIESHRENPASI
jgi:hypothetical protein